MRFLLEERVVEVLAPVPVTVVDFASKSGPQLATPGNSNEVLFIVPGVLLTYSVSVGDILKAYGASRCVGVHK